MASINVFCIVSELRDWIVDLCNHEDLGSLYFGGTEGVAKVIAPNDLPLSEEIYQIFLFPMGSYIPPDLFMNDVRQRDWGWMNIRVGGVKSLESGTCLLFSEMHGEKSSLPVGNPDRWVRWLKRKIKPEVGIGVVGKNLISGGSSKYIDIWHTKKAVELFKSGVIWKQFPSANSVFEPLS